MTFFLTPGNVFLMPPLLRPAAEPFNRNRNLFFLERFSSLGSFYCDQMEISGSTAVLFISGLELEACGALDLRCWFNV